MTGESGRGRWVSPSTACAKPARQLAFGQPVYSQARARAVRPAATPRGLRCSRAEASRPPSKSRSLPRKAPRVPSVILKITSVMTSPTTARSYSNIGQLLARDVLMTSYVFLEHSAKTVSVQRPRCAFTTVVVQPCGLPALGRAGPVRLLT